MYLLSFLQSLDKWDKWFFVKLNSQWTNSFLDNLLPFLRNSLVWAPLYLFILVFIVANYGKKGLWWCLLFLITVSLTDMAGGQLKELFHRVRPCQDAGFASHVRFIVPYCPISYSFVSNHAANHFGIATFLFISFRNIFKKWMWLAFAWALIISYSQVYVGVHYPLDVLGGTVVGIITGILTAWAFHKKWGTFTLDNQLK